MVVETDADPQTPTATGASNRRSHPRQLAKGEVICRTGKLGMGPVHRGRLINLSHGGAQIAIPKETALGEGLEIELIPVGRGRGFKTFAVARKVELLEDGWWQIGCEFEKRMAYDALRDYAR